MKLRGTVWSFDSRDLMRAQCDHCTRVSTARELGVAGLKELVDQYFEKPDNLAIRYGMKFEASLEQELLANLGELVGAPHDNSLEATLELMDQGMPVIYQGVLRGGSGAMDFSGRPDFLLRGDYRFEFTSAGLTARQVDGWSGGYSAWDAKLSSTPKPEYQVQVGLYLDVLAGLNYLAKSQSGLILGSRDLAGFNSDVLVAQMQLKRNAYLQKVFAFLDEDPQRVEDIGELVCEATSYCDICEYPKLCEAMRHEGNHLQLVANITKLQIDSLRRSGVKTVKELVEFNGETDKLSREQLAPIRTQARLQQHRYDFGESEVLVSNAEGLRILGEEQPGDIYFDLEGFTFFSEPGGLEYLFGWLDNAGQFHHGWADDRVSEQQIFSEFVTWFERNLEQNPNARIFHYANYEQAALKRLAARFSLHEELIESWLNKGIFVDLYKVVKASILVSEPKYSIKNLENFYTFKRASDVKEAMGSMEYYDQYLEALESDPEAAENLKRQVLSYNQDDCISTLALVRWLRSLRS
jgi:predicted RecB family nuclease